MNKHWEKCLKYDELFKTATLNTKNSIRITLQRYRSDNFQLNNFGER